MRHHRKAAAAVLALTLTACSTPQSAAPPVPSPTGGPAQASVQPDKATTLALPGSATVTVPTGAVSSAATLTITPETASQPAPTGMTALATPVTITLSTGTLQHAATLSFPLPPDVDPRSAVIAYYDHARSTWVPVTTPGPATAGAVTAEITHFSDWILLGVNITALLANARHDVANYFGVAAPEAPPCHGTPTGGVTISVTKGDLIRWCSGADTRGPYVRLVNNRRNPAQLTTPSGWTATHVGPADSVQQQVIDGFSGVLTAAPRGKAVWIVPGGGAVEVRPPAGGSGTVTVSATPIGWLFGALFYALDTFGMTLEAAPGVKKLSLTQLEKLAHDALGIASCAKAFDTLAHTDVTDVGSAFAEFRAGTDLILGCLGQQWAKQYGSTAAVGSWATGVVLWLIDGLRIIWDGLTGIIDTWKYPTGVSITFKAPQQVTFTNAQVLASGISCGAPPACNTVIATLTYTHPSFGPGLLVRVSNGMDGGNLGFLTASGKLVWSNPPEPGGFEDYYGGGPKLKADPGGFVYGSYGGGGAVLCLWMLKPTSTGFTGTTVVGYDWLCGYGFDLTAARPSGHFDVIVTNTLCVADGMCAGPDPLKQAWTFTRGQWARA